MTKTLAIVKPPHLLFMGANGMPTVGITVRRLESEDIVEKVGKAREWRINEICILEQPGMQEYLELSPEEYIALCDEVKRVIQVEVLKSRLRLK